MDIEKLQSEIYRFSDKYILKHVVKVSSKDKIGKRKGYHSVVKYSTNSYINSEIGEVYNINIHFKSYLLLESIDSSISWNLRQNIMITDSNIHKFIKKLKKANKWFKSKKYDDLFYIENNLLKLNKEMSRELVEFVNFNNDKSITIIPAVITDYGQNYEGVIMFVNNKNTVITLSINELRTLIYKLKKMDLYQAGLAFINYLGMPKKQEIFDIDNHIKKVENDNFNNSINTYNRKDYNNTNFNNKVAGYFK